MPYDLQWEPHGVQKRFYGAVCGAELLCVTEEVEADTRFDSLRFVINDFAAVTDVRVTPTHIQHLAAIDAAAALTNSHIKIAIVSSDANVLALGSIYVELHPFPARAFATLAEARAWCEGA